MRGVDYLSDLKATLSVRNAILPLSDDLLFKYIDLQRGQHFQRKYKKVPELDYRDIQVLPTVKCSLEGSSISPNIKSRELYLVSEVLPQPVFIDRAPLIQVYTNMFSYNFFYRTPDTIKFENTGFVNGKSLYYTYNMDKLYIKIPKTNTDVSLIDVISIDMIAEAPFDVMKFNGTLFKDYRYEEYPITDIDWSIIKNNVLMYNLGIGQQAPTNSNNDTTT